MYVNSVRLMGLYGVGLASAGGPTIWVVLIAIISRGFNPTHYKGATYSEYVERSQMTEAEIAYSILLVITIMKKMAILKIMVN